MEHMRLALSCLLATVLLGAAEPPKSWVDPDTGHRVVRLTGEPGSASLYFNQNAYTAGGRKMIYTIRGGIAALDLKTFESRKVVEGWVRVIVAGRRSQNVYYMKDGAVWVTDVETLRTRKVGELPPGGSVDTVNADETLVAGTYVEGQAGRFGPGRGPGGPPPGAPGSQAPGAPGSPAPPPPGSQAAGPGGPFPPRQQRSKGQMMEERLAAKLPMGLFVLDTRTGAVKTIHRATDWLNHLEFSPTDPTLLMFCHEGPWHKVDRIWTIRTDGTALTKVHTRTMQMEIFGHEFWSADGTTIWYDLQTPRGEDFWLAGYNVDTRERTWYHLQRNEWSIHFNVTGDGTLFCGDGGDSGQVARAPDGRWLYLFRPELMENRGVDGKALIRTGVLRAEKLVNMSKHEYRLEPNVSFTPDRKWVVFRSNMFGDTYTFAVEVEKAKP